MVGIQSDRTALTVAVIHLIIFNDGLHQFAHPGFIFYGEAFTW